MGKGVDVRQPSASATLGGTPVQIDGVSIQAAINQFPVAHVSFHEADGGVAQMASADVGRRIGSQQGQMFEAGTPTSSVSVNDGNSSLSFSGYVSSPAYSLAVQQVGLNTSVLHAASALVNLNTSVYRKVKPEIRRQASGMSGNITGNLKAVLEYMVKGWQNAVGEGQEESAAINEQIAANNGTGLGIWYQILDNSSVEWPELDPVVSGDNTLGINMRNSLEATYKSPLASFMGTMRQFLTMFNMLYVPSLEGGNMGRFIDVGEASADTDAGLELPITSIVMEAGLPAVMPLSYVVVRGPTLKNRRAAGGSGTVIARWPEQPLSKGKVEEMGAPLWLCGPNGQTRPEMVYRPVPSAVNVSDFLDISAYKTGLIAEGAKLKTVKKDIAELLRRIARNWYVDLALSPAQAMVKTTLDLSVELGKRYSVSSPDGHLFTGFLYRVEHNVSSNPGGTEASSVLQFASVEGAGFSLPHKT